MLICWYVGSVSAFAAACVSQSVRASALGWSVQATRITSPGTGPVNRTSSAALEVTDQPSGTLIENPPGPVYGTQPASPETDADADADARAPGPPDAAGFACAGRCDTATAATTPATAMTATAAAAQARPFPRRPRSLTGG